MRIGGRGACERTLKMMSKDVVERGLFLHSKKEKGHTIAWRMSSTIRRPSLRFNVNIGTKHICEVRKAADANRVTSSWLQFCGCRPSVPKPANILNADGLWGAPSTLWSSTVLDAICWQTTAVSKPNAQRSIR